MPFVQNRRQFLQTSLAATASLAFSRTLLAQAEAAPQDPVAAMRAAAASVKITTQPLRRNLSLLMGSGGNIVVLPGKDGKLVVDAGFATSRPQITEALAALSADPLGHLVDTHWHFDHTDGNEWMHAAGAKIVAHENTLKRLSTNQEIAAFHATFPPAPVGARPTITFAQDHKLRVNSHSLELSHYAAAHTDTDISVHFVEADVLHVGDTWFNGNYPFIDYSSGGNIDGMIAATQRNLARTSTTTMIVPGHGPLGHRAELEEYGTMLSTIRANVAKLKKAGRTLPETIAANPTASFDAKYGSGLINAPTFTTLVYLGV